MSDDRPKLSYSERDKLLRERRGSHDEPPRGRKAQQEQELVDRHALKQADELFSSGEGGAAGASLEKEIRDAHGTPELTPACRSYRDQLGMPRDSALLSLFLDTGDQALVVAALEGLLAEKNAGSLEIGPGLRSQLRVLADDRDDTIAGISEDLLQV